MRRRNTDLHARVNADLTLDFGEVKLTSYGGLELFQRYLRRMEFSAMIRSSFEGGPLGGDFGATAMIRLLVGLLVVGGRRLEHLAYMANDPLIQRFCQLRVLPAARTVSRWLKRFTMRTVERLQGLNAAVIAYVIPGLKLHTMTVDVDGTVVSTGLQVERARRGYNPHHRKVPSYYPIMAHLAETTHILRVRNRSGNVHDGKASLGFLRELWGQLLALAPRAARIRFRMDGAFFREDVLKWLRGRGAGYALKVPFYHWLDLQQHIRRQKRWTSVAKDVSGFLVPAVATPWGCTLWVAIYRRKVAHQTAKNFQLDLFDPDDGIMSIRRSRAIWTTRSAIFGISWPAAAITRRPSRTSRAGWRSIRCRRWPTRPTAPGSSSLPSRTTCCQFSDRDRRRTSPPIAQTHHTARAADDSDAALHSVSSRRSPGAARRQVIAALHAQCSHPTPVYAHRGGLGVRSMSFLSDQG